VKSSAFQLEPEKSSHRRLPPFAAEMLGLFLSALALYFAQPGSGGFSMLAWISLLPFFAVLERKKRFSRFAGGYFWGLSFYVPLLAWLRPFGPPAWLGLAGLEAIYPALFSLLAGPMLRRGGWVSLWGVAALWALIGRLGMVLSFGFSWGGLALTQMGTAPILYTASWWGGIGLTFLVALGNAAIWRWLRGRLVPAGNSGRDARAVSLALGCLLIAVLAGWRGELRLSSRIAASPSLTRIGLAQSNYGRAIFTGAYSDPGGAMYAYESLTERLAKQGCRWVLWPESAYPEEMPDRNGRLSRLAKRLDVYLLAGAFDYVPPDKSYNSLFCYSPQGRLAGVYHKRRRVPFGEFVPWRRYLPSLSAFGVPETDVAAGDGDGVMEIDGVRAGAGICFESLIPDLALEAARNGARVLLLATNDSYYGKTAAPVAHEAFLRLRSVETGLPAAQAAATGYSFLALPDGGIAAQSDLFQPEGLAVDVPDLGPSKTFWVRFPWLTWLALIGLVSAGSAAAFLRRGSGLSPGEPDARAAA
jgi:apolipoprotein N-acyltransferase